MLWEALSAIFFWGVKVNSAGKILQYPTIHVDFAVLLLKEVLLYFEEYRDPGLQIIWSKLKKLQTN